MTIEYRIKPVTRYIITRWESAQDGNTSTGSCEQRGTYDNGETAYQVAYALCNMEHCNSGEPLDSMNFVYPSIPDGVSVAPSLP